MKNFKRLLVSSSVAIAALGVTPARTAFAAPQGSCTTGNYIETTTGSDTVGSFGAPSGASSTGCTWTVPAGVTSVRVLVVAGGGGGGGILTAGGGGGGGLIHEVGFSVTPGASLSVTVGKGGASGANGYNQPGNYNNGANGDSSVFGSLTAAGGGGGGGGGTNSQIGNPGSSGGSGGGGGRCWVGCNTSLTTANANKRAGGVGTSGQGSNGGNAPFMSGGGGGGAGAAGAASTGGAAGNGGDGLQVDISGVATYYAGGGGGGSENTATRATGGQGGGGLGGANGYSSGAAGTAGTGGGGGGARDSGGGDGGSGTVIVRWGGAPVAPNISLSNTSGYGIVNSSVGSLYSISNTGGAVTSYSISPALPAGLSFNTVTGLISGTPTATSSAANYTITARRVDSGNGASSSSTATFNFGVYNVAPTTTTTSTSTTTTVAAATTTVAPATSVPSSSSTFVTIPSGGDSTGTSVATPTTALIKSSTSPTTVVPVSTTTTVPPTTTTTEPAPVTPEAAPGEAGATVDGESVETTLTRADNALVVSAGDISATVYGLTSDGQRVALDSDGNLQLEQQDRVVVSATGYEAGGDVEVWLRSTPIKLAAVTADARGEIAGTFALPKGVDAGDHRVVLAGRTKSGGDSVIGVGLRIGEYGKESNVNKWIISLAIALAITLALVIPTTVRRRKRANG